MKLPRPPKGFTLIELLVVISIIAVLASLAVPAVTGAITKGQLIQAVNNARQVQIATMSMANDGAANSDSELGWPGDITSITKVSDFVQRLVNYDYLKATDLKVFAAAGVNPYVATSATSASDFSGSNSAFYVYKVTDNDASNVVFLTTKNYDRISNNTLNTTTKPFGDKGFVVCRKGGDVSQFKRQQAGSVSTSVLNQIGSICSGSDKLSDN